MNWYNIVVENTKSQNLKNQELLEYIKQMINIDLKPLHVSEYDKKGFITIDWNKLNPTQKQQIKSLSKQYKTFSMHDYGAWGMWLKFD